MEIRRLQRRDIGGPGLICGAQAAASPGESRLPKSPHQEIRHQARPAAVAVWEGVNEHQRVVEADSDLVRRKAGVIDPVPSAVECFAEATGETSQQGTPMFLSVPAMATGPTLTLPYMRCHKTAMETARGRNRARQPNPRQRGCFAAPTQIQFLAQGDVGWDETITILETQQHQRHPLDTTTPSGASLRRTGTYNNTLTRSAPARSTALPCTAPVFKPHGNSVR